MFGKRVEDVLISSYLTCQYYNISLVMRWPENVKLLYSKINVLSLFLLKEKEETILLNQSFHFSFTQ